MVINFVLVAGAVVLSLIGGLATPASRTDHVAPAAVKVAARPDSFSPPPRPKKRPPPPSRPKPATQPDTSEDDVDEDQPAPRRPAAVRRRPAAEEDESDSADEEDDDEEKPRVKKKHKRVVDEEEEEEEDDAPMASLPVILPRVISFQAGLSSMGRNFAFNTNMQQKESTFPRPGIVLGVEAYPMLRMSRGWYRRIGVGANLAMEFGAAALASATTGASTSFPVTQRRWSFDLRYAIPAGERVVVVPALGLGSNVFDLKTLMPGLMPSQCDSASTAPCIADVDAWYAIPGFHLRIAATEGLSFSLSAGYLFGLSVSRKAGQIGVESTATKVSGFQVEPGVNFMLTDWLALRATVPIVRYSYAFTNQLAYKSATELYYGVSGGALIFMR